MFLSFSFFFPSISNVSSPVVPLFLFCCFFSVQYCFTPRHQTLVNRFLLIPAAFFQHNKPLYSFEDNADYVYDVMWSPVHPAMFAAVDGMGRLDLWNLNNDTEVCAFFLSGCIFWVILVPADVRASAVSSGPLAGAQPEPHNQTPKPPSSHTNTHDSRSPCRRFPQLSL